MAAVKVLVTGFEPFGGESLNPSALIVRALATEHLPGATLVTAELPCVFGQALEVLGAQLRRHRPEVVVCLGQAGGRPDLSVERVAINVDDARIPDNAGAQPVDQRVVAEGPAAYFSTLPIKAIVATLQQRGIPAGVSQTAGTFVCNHVFYGLMHWAAQHPGVQAGFIHVPWLPEQAVRLRGQASMALEAQVRGVTEALRVTLARRGGDDLRVGDGAVC